MTHKTLKIGFQNHLTLEDIAGYAAGHFSVTSLDDIPSFRGSIETNHSFMLEKVASGWPIYGATTGFGSSSANRLGGDEIPRLQTNLFRYHGCGVGPSFHESELAAILLVRLNCLSYGRSGVSFELLERLNGMAQQRVFPLIPIQGSVGASGDLTPLSYIAAVLAGERQALWQGKVQNAADIWQQLGGKPYTFKAREALSIMNGTSVMAAIAGLAWTRIKRFTELACTSTALMVELWQGPASPFFSQLHAAKPHAGQIKVAKSILEKLYEAPQRLLRRQDKEPQLVGAVQDPYSLRCVPQLVGSLQDVLDATRTWIETEINSVNDNPVFIHEEDLVLNGGHFFGGHIAAACDALKAATASVINLLDRQMALLMESKGRLPENLVSTKITGGSTQLHHGFKAMQITMSSLAAEAAKTAMPMSVFSRPTEASNQDVVSMGTIAARDLMSISDMAMAAASIQCMALRQSFYVLEEQGKAPHLTAQTQAILDQWSEAFPKLLEDRAMDVSIQKMTQLLFGDMA